MKRGCCQYLKILEEKYGITKAITKHKMILLSEKKAKLKWILKR